MQLVPPVGSLRMVLLSSEQKPLSPDLPHGLWDCGYLEGGEHVLIVDGHLVAVGDGEGVAGLLAGGECLIDQLCATGCSERRIWRRPPVERWCR